MLEIFIRRPLKEFYMKGDIPSLLHFFFFGVIVIKFVSTIF
jgi:hypothetical protein